MMLGVRRDVQRYEYVIKSACFHPTAVCALFGCLYFGALFSPSPHLPIYHVEMVAVLPTLYGIAKKTSHV
jgi:fucose permease